MEVKRLGVDVKLSTLSKEGAVPVLTNRRVIPGCPGCSTPEVEAWLAAPVVHLISESECAVTAQATPSTVTATDAPVRPYPVIVSS